MVAAGTEERGLYKLDAEPIVQQALSVTAASQSALWHARFGHVHYRALKFMNKHEMVESLPHVEQPASTLCEGCIKGKFHRMAFPQDGSVRAQVKLQLVHSDVVGRNSSKLNARSSFQIPFYCATRLPGRLCRRERALS